MFFKARLFWFKKTKLESPGVYYQKEEIDLYAFSQSHQLFETLIEVFRVKYKENERQVSTFDGNHWTIDGTFKDRDFDSIAISQKTKDKMISELDHFVSGKEWFYRNNMPYKLTFVFTGQAGTGKTSLTKAIASRYKRNVYCLNLHELSPKTLRVAMKGIKQGSLLLLEDFDSCVAVRSREQITDTTSGKLIKGNDSTSFSDLMNPLTLTDILNTFDGIVSLDDVIVIMTTNYLELIDPAMLRKGRVDHVFEIPKLTDLEIKNYLLHRFPDLELSFLAHQYPDISGCDLQALILEHRDNPSLIPHALKSEINHDSFKTQRS